jgi:hypothetical protein
MNCPGLSVLVVLIFFVHSIDLKYSLNISTVAFNSSTLFELLAINFIQTAFHVGGHSLSVSIETLSHSDSSTFKSSAINASISKTFFIHLSCLIPLSNNST